VLVEFHAVKQEPGQRRRWFEDDGMELIVWYGGSETPEGFQLCYTDRATERALSWREGQGFTHAAVDAGDTRPDKNLTPVLVSGGTVRWGWLRAEFARRATELPPDVWAWVEAKLEGAR
jgi:hypothetical protein